MTDTPPDNATDILSVTEAAARLGVSERTVWRRIKQGKLTTQKALDGVRVVLSVSSDSSAKLSDRVPDSVSEVTDRMTDAVSVMPAGDLPRALDLIERIHQEQTDELERLRRENQQLAGQLGFMQAKLQEAEKTIALLMAPKDEPEPLAAPKSRRPWWKRLFT